MAAHSNTNNLVLKIKESKKNINFLVSLLKLCIKPPLESQVKACQAVQEVFLFFIDEKEFSQPEGAFVLTEDMLSVKPSESNSKIALWLAKKYIAFAKILLTLMQDESSLQVLSFAIAMKLLKKFKEEQSQWDHTSFSRLVSLATENQLLFKTLQEFLVYDDIKLFFLESLRNLIESCEDVEVLETLFSFVESVEPFESGTLFCKKASESETSKPECGSKTVFQLNFSGSSLNSLFWLLERKKQKKGKKAEEEEVAAAHSKVWLALLKKSALSAALEQRALLRMQDKILPTFNKPLLLLDFLTQAYNKGGLHSVIALQGLFVLITKHNLHYPKFYPKLYSLLEVSLFYLKHKDKFFSLLDVCLSSSHLPQYLVAAFCKKLARLSLTAPPQGALILLQLIYNLLLRNPSCLTLIHDTSKSNQTKRAGNLVLLMNPGEGEKKGVDPFLEKEKDPSKSNALKSSLWEIKALEQHAVPSVARAAAKFSARWRKMPLAIDSDATYHKILQKELSTHSKKDTAFAIFKPESAAFDPLAIF